MLTNLVEQLGGRVERRRQLAGFRQERDSVAVRVDGPDGGEEGAEEIRASWRRTGDTRTSLTDMIGFSVYRVNQRVVDQYRRGRVLLAGDAAHVHTPAGGLGMNTGIQDAYSLGWRPAAAVHGADDSLVDDYERERRPVAQALLSSTDGLQRLHSIRNRRAQRARDIALKVLLDLRPLRQAFLVRAGQLDVTYRTGGNRSWRRGVRVGDRTPDGPAHRWPDGSPTWLHDHLRGTRPTLLLLSGARTHSEHRLAELARHATAADVPVVLIVPDTATAATAARPVDLTLVDTHGTLPGAHRNLRPQGKRLALRR